MCVICHENSILCTLGYMPLYVLCVISKWKLFFILLFSNLLLFVGCLSSNLLIFVGCLSNLLFNVGLYWMDILYWIIIFLSCKYVGFFALDILHIVNCYFFIIFILHIVNDFLLYLLCRSWTLCNFGTMWELKISVQVILVVR